MLGWQSEKCTVFTVTVPVSIDGTPGVTSFVGTTTRRILNSGSHPSIEVRDGVRCEVLFEPHELGSGEVSAILSNDVGLVYGVVLELEARIKGDIPRDQWKLRLACSSVRLAPIRVPIQQQFQSTQAEVFSEGTSVFSVFP